MAAAIDAPVRGDGAMTPIAHDEFDL